MSGLLVKVISLPRGSSEYNLFSTTPRIKAVILAQALSVQYILVGVNSIKNRLTEEHWLGLEKTTKMEVIDENDSRGCPQIWQLIIITGWSIPAISLIESKKNRGGEPCT